MPRPRSSRPRPSSASRSSRSSGRRPSPDGRRARGKRVRYAVVGQGYIAQVAVLPAFAHAEENSVLAAIVSGDPRKRRSLSRRYDVPIAVGYDDYDDLMESGEVDAVYVALPNSMHRDFTVRAARAGVHVLCEKPMAVTSAECRDMIRAAERGGVALMVAYRLHFEKANLSALEVVREGTIGRPRFFDSVFSMQVKAGNVRLDRELGGGTLYDIGIYCLNAARSVFRDEPTEVVAFTANSGERRFREVDEQTSAVLRFPGERLATFTSSFGAADAASYTVVGTEGSIRVDPAYEFAGELAWELTVGGRTRRRSFPRRDQFAPELLYFSDCVLGGKEPEPGGREGLADVRVIEALYRSAREGRPVSLPPFGEPRHPSPAQEIRRRAPRRPELVHAESPHPE
jgi:predicted dehydrogenase